MCSVRLKAASRMHWGRSKVGVYRDYKVVRRRCQPAAMGSRAGAIVLSSKTTGTGSHRIKAMRRGQLIRLTWSLGWADVMDSVGGMPLLVNNGKPYNPSGCSSYFCSRNPRTAIGVTADGKVLLVVVDGRRSGSVGLTLVQWAKYMIQLGAVYAVNLDGGGGSTMWVKGQGVVNVPSDYSGERPVTNAVLVLPGADPDETVPGPFKRRAMGAGSVAAPPTVDVESPSTGRRTVRSALVDPGSTGGLMDALLHGDLGAHGPVPPSFLEMARVFRAAH
jgi:hypothetical protein